MSNHNNDSFKDEIKKEFQLERMILFSDAVFAIVITLMAIEIQLPHAEHSFTKSELIKILWHLLPVALSYTISFIFIGATWYQHLQVFGLLRDYDKGLVFKNLTLLFFVGLFPFSSTVISRGPKGDILPFVIYFIIIIGCIGALALIEHHILYKKPELRKSIDAKELNEIIEKYNTRKFSLWVFLLVIVLIFITDLYIIDKRFTFLSTMWTMLIPISFAIRKLKNKLQNKQ